MGTDPDQLPLMQHALMRMWTRAIKTVETSDQITLTLEDYKRAGGLEKALSNHANEAYDELSTKDQPVARTLFRVLTERGSDRRDIRRPTNFKTIIEISAAGKDPTETRQQVTRVVDAFRQADRSFLMPQAHVSLDDTRVLDISHESLIRQWDRLKKWTGEEADAADTYLAP